LVLLIKEDEVGGHVARMGKKWSTYRLLVGEPEGKRPLGRRCRWVDNIQMGLVEVRWGDVVWIGTGGELL
jgi:hypothetical protein